LENDSYFVDMLAMNGLTSAPMTRYPGYPDPLTFEEWRRLVDGDPSLNFSTYTRYSSLNRSDSRLGADVYWRPIPRGSLRLGYQYRVIDRDNVALADGTGETTHHTLKAGWNQRINKKLRWNNSLLYRTTDNPYAYVDGGRRAYLSDPATGLPVDWGSPSPKSPISLQYYQLHELRVADLSSNPSGLLKFRSNATYMPGGKWSLGGNLRFSSAENDELDYSTWENDSAGVGVNLWVIPTPEFNFTVSYDVLQQTTDTLAAVPLMDG
jgi:hypothetical protein